MAVSSVSSFLLPSFAIPSSSASPPTRQKVSLLQLLPSSSHGGGLGSCVLNKPSISFTKVFAAPETLDSTLDEPVSEEVHFFLLSLCRILRLFAKTMLCFAESMLVFFDLVVF